jgi:hypothetical protein
MSVTTYLTAHGWRRTDEPALYVGECGASSDTVGYCEKSARWSRGGGFLCAQHAAQAQRLQDACPRPVFATPDTPPDYREDDLHDRECAR